MIAIADLITQLFPGKAPVVDYRVELDIYNGPLDLLLYLIKRDELDIHDIPIARITDSYMAFLRTLKDLRPEGLDINVAGDFLVTAATLMEIKSATLLPKPPPDPAAGEPSAADEIADPRYELVQKLLEYKAFKDRAMALEHRAESHARRFPRRPAFREDAANDEPPPVDLEEVAVWDLLAAFQRLMKEVGQRKPRYHEVVYDDTPIDLHAADISDRLRREKRLSFRQLLEGRKSRSEMIGVFLALLELIREKKVLVHQSEGSYDIEIEEAPEEHRKGPGQPSLRLADDQGPGNDATPDNRAAHHAPEPAAAAADASAHNPPAAPADVPPAGPAEGQQP